MNSLNTSWLRWVVWPLPLGFRRNLRCNPPDRRPRVPSVVDERFRQRSTEPRFRQPLTKRAEFRGQTRRHCPRSRSPPSGAIAVPEEVLRGARSIASCAEDVHRPGLRRARRSPARCARAHACSSGSSCPSNVWYSLASAGVSLASIL